MKAVVQDAYGPPEVLRVQEIDKPEPGPGEVLVRVRAAGLDPGVWHLTTGRPYLLRLALGLRAPRVRIRGLDLAGVVEAVGAGVESLGAGDEVFGTCDGSFAQYACTGQDRLHRKPENLTFEQAAVVPVSACTALKALREAGRLRDGERVLVIGAGGGVGSFAVQLAKTFGAHVTGVCSTSKTGLVRSLGADEVIDYTGEDPTAGGRRFDLVVDTAGNRPLAALRRVLTTRGTLVIVGGEGGGAWLGGADRQLRALALSPFVRHRLLAPAAMRQSQEDLRLLAGLIEEGRLTPVIDRTYGLDELPEAVRHLERGHARGKSVIRVP
ncbi:NAD(P)-dependent alcohol dehydrogenase [Kitasatospora sp. MAP5-34]|uniref:NAD(P)-dependent alcohol dehydrogenase n=1 Tax=Kitasatospora sp. MAP5-34 TaxID=3035102 RepID=UPI002473D70E|nr:NAD(P)-dependent alcohol dehydrogenase [Kitasatospora sp. MAP5-34]MDH6580858.1 NADPH:quinone reductase-like Zn-dependent oxidoreductase [Kitasatospora sp. MAP5-34]